MTFHEASEDTFSEQDALPFTTSPLPLAIDESDNATSEVAPVPQVHPVPQVPPARIKEHTQKGVGLKSLQNALSIFSENPSLPLPELEKPQESKENDYSFQRQSRLEQDVLSSALDRWRAEQDKSVQRNGAEGNLSSLGSLMWQWHEVLTRLINQEVIKIKESELKGNRLDPDGENPLIGPYLQYINPVKISAVTILTVIGSMSRFGVDRPSKIANLATKVGRAIEVESLAELFKNTPPFNERGKQRAQKKVGACERQYKLASLIKKAQSHESVVKAMNAAELSSFSRRDLQWSSTTKVKIGALLISFLLKAAKMDVKRKNPETGETTVGKQPAFWNSHHFQLGKRIGVLRMNPVLTARLAKEPVACALARHLPMVVEPRPWTSHREGAFLSVSSPVVRMRSGHDQVYKYIRAAAEGGDLVQLFAGLNVLGKTPWKINRPVFDVMSKVWNSGEALVDFPPEDPKIEYPPEPDLPKDHIDHRRWVYQVKGLNNIRCGLHSQRCHLNFILEIARAYLNETMYFPHNVDFRGRAYPMSPYLNHMGADYCRGLLLFADGKELGPRGLTWLKVHLANVAGYDKASLEERRAFTENHLSDIYDSAMKPLDGDRWWLQAEDPWQCLAACMELKNALDSPDPTKFVSFLAVHQDGTCNGLQHYAALGGDTIGAKQVNLEPGDRPSDVYTAVANHVNREIVVEAAQGDKKALFLEGKVTRKIVKTTVMTNVYGVTFIGAKLQVQKNLVDAYPDFPNTSDINLSNCAIYITHKVFKALSSMFNGARDIQNWLGECASRICASLSPDQMDWIEENAITEGNEPQFAIRPSNDRSHKDEQTRFKTSVIWTTPLKMPVVQPYRQAVDQNVMTNLQKMTIMDPSAADSVVRRKQLQAFAPNFIHSLDATHMLLSALKSDEEGLTFAAVHDSFWTHAADIDKMNIILRDAFIRMHSEDIIGRLATEFSTRHKDYMYLASIRAKSVLGRKLIQFRKQRRKDAIGKPRNKAKNPGKPSSLLGELLVEKRRLRLLASEDPAARAEGESMMTPSRIAETADEEDFQVDEYETAIGTMSTTADDAFANDVTSVEDDDDIGSLESNDTSVNRNNIGSLDDLTGIDTIVQAPTAGQDFEQIDKLKVEEMKRQAKRGEAAAKEMLLKAKNAYYRKIRVWMPLTFPPVPKKVTSKLDHYFCDANVILGRL